MIYCSTIHNCDRHLAASVSKLHTLLLCLVRFCKATCSSTLVTNLLLQRPRTSSRVRHPPLRTKLHLSGVPTANLPNHPQEVVHSLLIERSEASVNHQLSNMTSQKQSKYPTQQFSSSDFVESCGAIPLVLAKRQVYLLHNFSKGEWLLAKGRRDCNELRREAAIREVREETGLNCRLLPVSMPTRAPAIDEPNDVVDKARVYPDLVEPFMFTLRQLPGVEGVKLIFWFIAAVDEDDPFTSKGEETYKTGCFDYAEAIEKLTYRNDRDLLERAIELAEQSYPLP